ncbi:hypothetical protein SDC9_137836 [bioreactor metagenome]|uniref:Uncharacterized protein n=1 Tax=bioreactor metagenome TaxID=1076179 RepID=A0A645DMP3_9ZZZZ
MPFAIGKADHLVLDGGTVAGTFSHNLAPIERGTVNIGPYDLVSTLVRPGNVARKHRPVDAVIVKTERHHDLFAILQLHLAEIETALAHSCRSTCFQPSHREAFASKSRSQPDGSALIQAAVGSIVLADEDPAFHERSGSEYQHTAGDGMPTLRHHPHQALAFLVQNEVHHRIHEQGKVWLGFQRLLCKAGIGELVSLSSGCLHCRTATPVENPILDHRVVYQVGHLPTKGIHLPDQVAL